ARPKIATVERREASVSERRGRLTRALGAPQGALRGCRSTRTLSRRSATPHFGCAKPKAKPGRKKRAAGTRRYVCEWKCIQVKSDHHAQQTQSYPCGEGRREAPGWGSELADAIRSCNCGPHPQPLPTSGRGVDRAGGRAKGQHTQHTEQRCRP